MDGQSRGEVALERALDDLEERGSNVLVTGRAPAEELDRLSTWFLGRERDRVRLFALLDADLAAARRRLRRSGRGREPSIVIDCVADGTRSATASGTRTASLDVRRVDESPEALTGAVLQAIADAHHRHGPFDGPELRLSVDSLRPLGDAHGVATLRRFLDTVTDAVTDVGGMAHYMLPGDRSDPLVQALYPDFEVIVELRPAAGAVEQRWRFPDDDVTTPWTEV